MAELGEMIWIELRKVLRSRIPLFTLLGTLVMPLGIAFLIFVSRNPQIARNLGLISAKANLTTVNITSWPAYMNTVAEIVAAGGFFFFVMAISWVFGREFTDGTVKDLLAVPVSRQSILLAKFIVVSLWMACLAACMLAVSLVVGVLSSLPATSTAVQFQGVLLVVASAGLTIAVVLPFALVASAGRGYLLPLGAAILVAILGNLVVIAGWGDRFPWAVPGLYAQGKGLVTPLGIWVVLFTALLGLIGTYLWWRYTDQNR